MTEDNVNTTSLKDAYPLSIRRCLIVVRIQVHRDLRQSLGDEIHLTQQLQLTKSSISRLDHQIGIWALLLPTSRYPST